LDDDDGSRNVSRNRAAMIASGVAGADHRALADGYHLPSKTGLACFSGFGSRKADMATSLSLRRDT
jgi:hypothetical protein